MRTELEKWMAEALQGRPPVAIIPLDPRGTAGRMARHHEAFDRLLDTGGPFVAVTFPGGEDEDQEDRAAQARWFHSRLSQLVARCRLLVIVEPDIGQRAKLQQRSAEAHAFPIPLLIAADLEEAVSLGYAQVRGWRP